MDDFPPDTDDSAVWQGRKAAVLAQTQMSDALFALRLKRINDDYISRRQGLLLSLSALDAGYARARDEIRKEFDETEVAWQRRLAEIDAASEQGKVAKAFAKLPAEILAHIFIQGVEGDLEKESGEVIGTSPWVFAQVCRFWCQTCMSTPSLWRKLLVTDYSQFYWSLQRNKHIPMLQRNTTRTRSHSSLQVCVNPTEVAQAVQKSGVAPLDITLGISGRTDTSEVLPNEQFYTRLYASIFNDQVAPRISRLVFESNPRWTLRWTIQKMSGLYIRVSNLASLEIHSLTAFSFMVEGDVPMLRAIIENATRLNSLRVGTDATPDFLRHTNRQDSRHAAVIDRLKELRVSDTSHLDSILHVSNELESLVIDSTARIEALAEDGGWEGVTFPWPTLQTRSIIFLSLVRLHLIVDDFSLLDRFQFPALEELRLTESSVCRRSRRLAGGESPPLINPDFVLDLPKLRALRVTSHRIACIRRFLMPQLERLHLTSTRVLQTKGDADLEEMVGEPDSEDQSPTALSGPLTENPFKAVRHLHIHANVTSKGIITTLEAFPLLESLYLVPGKKLGNKVITALTVGKHKRHLYGIPYPRLKVVQFDCYSFRKWDRSKKAERRVGSLEPPVLVDLMEAFVLSRKKWGEPLERCTFIGQGGEKREFVPV